jgi:hypothetical protein
MFKWFRDCKTAEEGKTLYRELAKKFHPDNGASGEELKEIILEFKRWYEQFKNVHTDKDGKTYTSKKATTQTAEEFIDIINNLSTIPGIEVELCGDWLWITGSTYPYKDILKQFGCRWSVGKKKWYWTTAPYTKRSVHPSMETIRNMYGSENIELNRRAELE